MTQTTKTLILAGLAVAGTLAAIFAVPGNRQPEMFKDEGQDFFTEFDPNGLGVMQVVTYSKDDAVPREFRVERQGDQWTIPSHDGYPADISRQLADTATLFVGLKKASLVATSENAYATFHVIDPLQPDPTRIDRHGKRVTLKDKTGKTVADLIIGKPVEGREGFHYVREPDAKRTYTARIDADDVSTRFADWVQTNVLDLSSWDIRQVVLDLYSVDERQGRVIEKDKVHIVRNDENQWTLKQAAPEGLEPDRDKLQTIIDALTDITLVDVRRKDPMLMEVAKQIEKGVTVPAEIEFQVNLLLQPKGYFFTGDPDTKRPRLYANEGEVRVAKKNGVVFTLRFGEVMYGDPDKPREIKQAETREGAAAEMDDPSAKEHRYLLITADFNSDYIGQKPEEPAKPEMPRPEASETDESEAGDADQPSDEADAGAEGGEASPDGREEDAATQAWEAYDQAMSTYRSDLDSYERKVEQGQKEAARLNSRFADWYYIISAEAYRDLKIEGREALLQEVEEDDEESADGSDAAGTDDDGTDASDDAETDEAMGEFNEGDTAEPSDD